MDPVVVDRYVLALFGAAQKTSQEQLVEQDLLALRTENRRSGLKNFLENPRYPRTIKLRTIESIGTMFVSNLMTSFLRVLLMHSRIGFLEEIAERYTDLYRESKGIVVCDLVFVSQPGQEFLKLVEEELKRITHLDVELRIRVDPAILGGVRLAIKNYVLDGTYRKRLESMKDRLLEGQYT